MRALRSISTVSLASAMPVARTRRAALTATPLMTSGCQISSGTDKASSGAAAAAASSGPGLFGSLRKKWENYELQRDRMLDAQAQDEAAEQRRQRFQPLTSEEGGRCERQKDDDGADDATGAHDEAKPIWENPRATPRSILFVPASKPRAMQKIYNLTADCYILDLEDSVGPAMKRAARDNVRQFVDEVAARVQAGECPPTRLIVRINSPDRDVVNAMLDLELVGLLGMSIEGVAIPKVSLKTYDVIKEYVHPNHQLWAFFETPQAILDAPQICAQSYYRYAVMASNDLAAELRLPGSGPRHARSSDDTGADGHEASSAAASGARFAMEVVRAVPLWHATMQVLLSARAQGMQVIGGVFNDPTDRAGFAQQVACDRALGLDGKTLIHPSQIDATNAAWTPAQEELQWAYRIREALARAQGGVATVDGVMVEQLHVRQASRLIALYTSGQATRRTAEAMESATVGRVFAEDDEDNNVTDEARALNTAEEGEEWESDGQPGTSARRRARRRGAPPSRHQPARPM